MTILDAAIDRVELEPRRVALTVHVRRTDRDATLAIDVDEVIAATGFTAPLQDLPALGCAVAGQSRLPVQTPWWESATLPGLYLRGHHHPGGARPTASRRALQLGCGPRRAIQRAGAGGPHRDDAFRGDGATSGTVDRGGRRRPDRSELTESPDLFHQRGYLARVLTVDGSGGLRDDGVVPLAHALDSTGERLGRGDPGGGRVG